MSLESLFAPGTIAPLDGGHARGAADNARAEEARGADGSGRDELAQTRRQDAGATENDFGPNNERLEELKTRLVAALRETVNQFRQEGLVARRHEARSISQARMFWQGL